MTTLSPAAPQTVELFHSLFTRYLHHLPGTEKFIAALSSVDSTSLSPPPIEDPAGPFITDADWSAMASQNSRPLVDAFSRRMRDLPWHVPYLGDPAAGPGFAERAASTGRIGPIAPVRSPDVAGGFFVVGRDVDYLDHNHRPEELYLPVAGEAEFWNEDTGWSVKRADDAMIHPSWQWHGMRTTDKPVLIFWMWLGPEGFGDLPALRPTLGGDDYDLSG
ncbi:MAG: dimethylsulfonioproprionate lyase family protein [Pseudomonadota bacterium]